MNLKKLSYPYAIWMVIFIVLPLGLVLYYAMTNADGQFTLSQFGKFFQGDNLIVLGRSLWLAFLCTVICLVLGYPIALILASRNFKRGATILVLFLIPMWMNFLLRTYAWVFLLEKNGVIYQFLQTIGFSQPPQMLYTPGAVVLGMVYNFLPFMVLPIYSTVKKMDHSLTEAAQDLGANNRRVFAKITLPLSMPGIISGITMVFMPAASTFVISKLMGGGKQMLIGDLIEDQFMLARNWNFGSAISIILMLLILVSMAFVNGATEADLNKKGHRQRKGGGRFARAQTK